MVTGNKLGLFCLLLAALGVVARAHVTEYDEYWREREAAARRLAEEAYHPDPEEVTDELNEHVNKAIEGLNTTRRHLTGNFGSCTATNPIDRCWRCRPNWQKERKRLARCAKGFGRHTTGGLRGRYYVVTDSSDSSLTDPKPGTLRHAVIQTRPLWITFAADMVIRLQQELIVQSDKTIDGRGAEVHIAHGAGFTIQYVHNVIIHGIHIHEIKSGNGGLIRDSVDHFGLRTPSDGDGISIFGSSNIWLDHLTMSRCTDGLIDATMGSTAITISNSFFTYHDKVLLFGATDAYPEDERMQITVAFNHFGEGLVQRMPRCRRGFFHVLNNDYTQWRMYAIGGSKNPGPVPTFWRPGAKLKFGPRAGGPDPTELEWRPSALKVTTEWRPGASAPLAPVLGRACKNPTIISQGNRFVAPDDLHAKQVTKRESATEETWKHWVWKSEGDLMVNGAYFTPSGAPLSMKHSRHDKIKAKHGGYASRLTRFSGALHCRAGRPC
uniref:Pectate lyase n=1 Tax=Kalanchoe fedtschenkoi TaxID=63787 RepID=A0A7N0REL8_KALFE